MSGGSLSLHFLKSCLLLFPQCCKEKEEEYLSYKLREGGSEGEGGREGGREGVRGREGGRE